MATEITLHGTLKRLGLKANKDGTDPLPEGVIAFEYSSDLLRLMPKVGQTFRVVFIADQLELPQTERTPARVLVDR